MTSIQRSSLPGAIGRWTYLFIGLALPAGLGLIGQAQAADPITATPSAINMNYTLGDLAPHATLSLDGPVGASFKITIDALFFGVAPAIGTLPYNNIDITAFPAYMTTPGVLHGNITVTVAGASNSPLTVPVTVTVVAPSTGTLTVPTAPLTFNYTLGGAVPASVPLAISGTSGLAFTTSKSQSWLVATPSSGTVPASLSVGVSPAGLSPGSYSGAVTVTSTGATGSPATIPVTLNVQGVTASPASLSFTYQVGGTAPASQAISVGGTASLAFTAAVTSGNAWLSVAPASGTVPATVTASVNVTGLTAGTYSGNIAIAASGVPTQNVAVTLVVSSAAAISPSPTSFVFSATIGGGNPAGQILTLGGATGQAYTLASDSPWLSVAPASGTTPGNATVSVNPGSLASGSYNGKITVTAPGAGNSPVTIPVTLTVTVKPTVTVSPSALTFDYLLGSPNPASQTINVTATSTTAVSATVTGAAWLAVTTSSGQTPAVLTATVNPTGLTAGSYTGSITIATPSAAVTSRNVAVVLTVGSGSQLSAAPASLDLSAPLNGSAVTATIAVSSTSPVTVSVAASDAAWLSVSPLSAATPATLTVTATPGTLVAGNYTGSVTISGPGSNTVVVPVKFAVTVPTIDGITDAAGYETTAFAPGIIISIFGEGLGPVTTDSSGHETGVTFQLNSAGGLDNTLGGVKITVDGVPAIPLFVYRKQINAIVPFSAKSSGQAAVVVEYSGAMSAPFNIPMAPAAMRLFSADFTGKGPGAILNQDFSVNTATNPAAKGSVVQLFGTGGGAMDPVVTDGGVAGATLSMIVEPYSATVNGEDAKVWYAGTAPGLVFGVYQVNVQLPADTATGSAVIVVKVGDSQVQPDLTVFVK